MFKARERRVEFLRHRLPHDGHPTRSRHVFTPRFCRSLTPRGEPASSHTPNQGVLCAASNTAPARRAAAQRGSRGYRLRAPLRPTPPTPKAADQCRRSPVYRYIIPLEIRCKYLLRERRARALFWQLKRRHSDVLPVRETDTICSLSPGRYAEVGRVASC